MISLQALGVTESSLLQNVIPDDVAHEVTHGLDGFFNIATVFLDLGPNELHDCVTPLLTCLQKETGRHLVHQTAQSLDLA